LLRRPPTPTLFPYTTLFRSAHLTGLAERAGERQPAGALQVRVGADDGAGEAAHLELRAAHPHRPVQGLAHPGAASEGVVGDPLIDRKSTRLNSSHVKISYAV